MTELLTVDEASERYANQWMIMRVHEYDKYETPVRGEIILVGKHRSDLHPADLALIRETIGTGFGIYIFRSHHRAAHGGRRRFTSGDTIKQSVPHDSQR